MSHDVLPLTQEALSGLSPPVPFLDPLSASDGSSFGDSDSTISLPSTPTSPEPAGQSPLTPALEIHLRPFTERTGSSCVHVVSPVDFALVVL